MPEARNGPPPNFQRDVRSDSRSRTPTVMDAVRTAEKHGDTRTADQMWRLAAPRGLSPLPGIYRGSQSRSLKAKKRSKSRN